MTCKKDPKQRKLALYYFSRLRYLVALKRSFGQELNKTGERLLNKALFSIYCTLLDLGHKKVALWYINHPHPPFSLSTMRRLAPPSFQKGMSITQDTPQKPGSPPNPKSIGQRTTRFLEEFETTILEFIDFRNNILSRNPRSNKLQKEYKKIAIALLSLWMEAKYFDLQSETEILLYKYGFNPEMFNHPPFV